jgi:hypothetical protein
MRAPASGDMLAHVKRATSNISDELDARLRHEAQSRGVTISRSVARRWRPT